MDMQPGNVIMPRDDQGTNEVQLPVDNDSTQPNPTPVQIADQPSLGVDFVGNNSKPEQRTNRDLARGMPSPTEAVPLPPDVAWTASEFVEHQKSAQWYGLLIIAALILTVAVYLLTKDIISTGTVVMAAVIFGLYAAHKPKMQEYHLNPQGIQIGAKAYLFQSFRNFSIVEEGAVASIILMPLGRFTPPLTVYLSSDAENQVVEYLSIFLPFEQHRSDAMDGLLRRIRF